MNSQIVGTIVLSGNDAIDLINSLFRPTQEQIKNNKKRLEYINENIKIINNTKGFESEIDDLDLSFLE